MERIKTNKTTMWTLVKHYTEGMPHEIDVRSRCTFQKVHHRLEYIISWATGEYRCCARLGAVLSQTILTFCVDGKTEMLRGITNADLRRRGMMETVVTAAERKRGGDSHRAQ